jgi:hypothetical protein
MSEDGRLAGTNEGSTFDFMAMTRLKAGLQLRPPQTSL